MPASHAASLADPAALAEARSRTWGLLGRLLLEGPSPAVDAWIAAVPSLAAVRPGGTPDEVAADHHRVLVQEVFPHEAVFLGPDGQLGGDVAASVRALFGTIGFGARTDVMDADHLGWLALGMAHLTEAEAHARRDGVADDVVARLVDLQARLLGEHLLAWAPACAVALQRAPDAAFHATVATMVVELALAHGVEASEPVLGPPIDVLDAPKAGLATVARALLVPSRTGWFLGAGTIGRVAATVDLPHGFGARWKRLETLLVTGVDHGQARDVLGALDAEAVAWDEALAAFGALGAPVQAWRDRLVATRATLARLTDAAR